MANKQLLSELSQEALLNHAHRLEKEIAALKTEIHTLRLNNTSLCPQSELYTLKDIIAFMPGNVFWKDNQGVYLGCNNNLAKFQGFKHPDEIIGKRNEDFMPVEYAKALDKIDQEIIQSGEGLYIEEIGLDINREPAIFFSQKIPRRDPAGNVIGILGISMDITERKKIERELTIAKEKAEASDQAKSQFLAVINHELRTPLTGILGLANFLKQPGLSEQERTNFIEDLENCGRYLLDLVNNVLDFSRLEASEFELDIKAVHPTHLIQEIMSIFTALAKSKHLLLQVQIKPEIPETIFTDSRAIHQILINLVGNAIKFTDAGQITIEVSSSQHQTDSANLTFVVRDTGQGIPPDKLRLIFEPFKQLEDAYKRQSSRSGTGLGLSIAKKLAVLIGADIKVESEVGIGSAFILTGKFATVQEKVSNAKLLQETIPPQPVKQHFTGLHVLLVEDDRIVRLIHKKLLQDLGCQVDVAENGLEALDLIKDHHFLFVDIGLPDITGFDVIQKIRKQHGFKNLRIIALTGYIGEEEKTAALTIGANEMISKPISLEGLQSILIKHGAEKMLAGNNS